MITRAWYPKRKGLNGLLLAAHLPATTADTSSHGNSINTCRSGFFSAAPRCELDCYSLTMSMGCHHRTYSSPIHSSLWQALQSDMTAKSQWSSQQGDMAPVLFIDARLDGSLG